MILAQRWRGRAREVMGRRAGREGFQRERPRTLRVGRWRVRGRRRGTSPADERRFLAWPRKPASLREKAKRSGDRERGRGRNGERGLQERKRRKRVMSKAHTRQQGLRRERSSTSLANALAHAIDLPRTVGRGGRWRGVVARAKQVGMGMGMRKGGERAGGTRAAGSGAERGYTRLY